MTLLYSDFQRCKALDTKKPQLRGFLLHRAIIFPAVTHGVIPICLKLIPLPLLINKVIESKIKHNRATINRLPA